MRTPKILGAQRTGLERAATRRGPGSALALSSVLALLVGCGAPSSTRPPLAEATAQADPPTPPPPEAPPPERCDPAPTAAAASSLAFGDGGSAASLGCRIYYLSRSGQLSILDVRTGELIDGARSEVRAPYVTLVAGETSLFAVHSNGEVTRYDPRDDRWSPLPALPEPSLRMPAVIALGGDLYVFGGEWLRLIPPRTIDSGASDRALVLRNGRSEWETLPAMPSRRAAADAVLHETRIWIIGGRQDWDGLSVDTTLVVDPRSWTWDTALGPGCVCSTVVRDGRFYAFGKDISDRRNGPRTWSPGDRRWVRTGARPAGTGDWLDAALVMDGRLWALTHSPHRLFEVDPERETWRPYP